jgi:hypothetical protein
MRMKPVEPFEALERFIAEHGSRAEACKALGIKPAYLSDLLNGRRGFSENILNALGLKRIVVKHG